MQKVKRMKLIITSLKVYTKSRKLSSKNAVIQSNLGYLNVDYPKLQLICPVSNHFYFKADSKYLLRGNKISALLLQSTIIPLNNETQFVSLELCFEAYNDFEVDRQLT